jgi:hypothetical protein
MSQPTWKCIAQLGDASPTEHGGYWIFVDTTGVYPPEAELLEVPDNLDYNSDDEPTPFIKGEHATAWRFILEDCTYINEVLSDNKFHPEMGAWFAPDSVAQSSGIAEEELVRLLCSVNPLERAEAWRAIGDHYGFDNLDEYPLTMTAKEVVERYAADSYVVKD